MKIDDFDTEEVDEIITDNDSDVDSDIDAKQVHEYHISVKNFLLRLIH